MRTAALLLAGALAAMAHPMGNFSLNQYTRILPCADRVQVLYAVDLAESPAFALLHSPDPAKAQVDWMRERVRHLRFTSAGRVIVPRIEGIGYSSVNGSGGLGALRIDAQLRLVGPQHSLDFEDDNFTGEPGWKEIVIRAGPGAAIVRASHSDRDRSEVLTKYPLKAGRAPYDLRAHVEWKTSYGPATAALIEPIPQPQPPAAMTTSSAPPPTAKKGDFLSTLLGRRDLSLGLALAGLAVAFGLGAMHALSPGHGKTIVAAYLVGSHGTLRHAVLLGGVVTFTHTVSVFLLGLGTLLLSRYVVPERIYPVLGAISGLTIVAIGAVLLWKRIRHARAHAHDHPHHHEHGLAGHHHHHPAEGDVSLGGLIALGASGGLVPCPSALVLLLSSIALGRTALGLALLTAFSLGLALVLMVIGALVLYARAWLPDTSRAAAHPGFRFLPILSAAVIVSVGVIMTGVSLGLIRPGMLAG